MPDPASVLLRDVAVVAMLSGHHGYRPIGRFLRANADDLREHLDFGRHGLPSFVTVRAVLQALDFSALAAAFRAWAAERMPAGEVLAVDAKAVRSTVSDHDNAAQDFVALVSAYHPTSVGWASAPASSSRRRATTMAKRAKSTPRSRWSRTSRRCSTSPGRP